MTNAVRDVEVAVIGGGPAGLMAAEAAVIAGARVTVFDGMASVGRKFLLAGKGGLNLTHSEPSVQFPTRYGTRATLLKPALDAFGPEAIRDWALALGVATVIGSSGRVFPSDYKAATLLRRWLHRLRAQGVRFVMRRRWRGWSDAGDWLFESPAGPELVSAQAVVLALGGASWPRLGADGAWVETLSARGVAVAPLKPSNCGFEVAWSAHLRERFAGAPVKPVAARTVDRPAIRGELMVTAYGVEGGVIYALSAVLREQIALVGRAQLELDLTPDLDLATLTRVLGEPRGARSMATHLKRKARIDGVKSALLHEVLSRTTFDDPAALARSIKALPVRLTAARPLAEAISTAGGIQFEALDERLMLRAIPGVFAAGEMLDWEAPTGGYLLTACLATGHISGAAAAAWAMRGREEKYPA
ncbi:MAG: TIGR03862 family flavoprotein [Gammaproteobacteria bacterium]|nr:TIGR03862 family flavoprotein [Gammaproteobacteria bacterium]